MKPSAILQQHRLGIRELLSHFPVANVRVFGSVAQGTDTDDSDLDLLVDRLPETTLFDLGGLQDALETDFGIKVDIRTPEELPAQWRQQVLAEAKPL